VLEQQRVRLVAIDLDGTLLTSSGVVTPRTIRAVRGAQAAGAEIALISARPPQSIEEIRATIGATGAVSAYNGALCYEPSAARPLYEATLTAADAWAAIAIGREAGLHVSLYVGRLWLVEHLDAAARREAAATAMWPEVVRDLRVAAARGAHKVLLVGPEPDLTAARQLIALTLPTATAVGSLPRYLEVVSSATSKGVSLHALADHRGVPRGAILTIGDGQNDIAMFAEAGRTVAMGNAAATVREAAAIVAPTNDEDGVAWALEHLVPSDG